MTQKLSYQTIKNRCFDDIRLTQYICVALHVPIDPYDQNSSQFNFNLIWWDDDRNISPFLSRMENLYSYAETYEEKNQVLDICLRCKLSGPIIKNILLGMLEKAVTFSQKLKVATYGATNTDHPEDFSNVHQWLTDNGTFNDWQLAYLFGFNSKNWYITNWAVAEMSRILSKESN